MCLFIEEAADRFAVVDAMDGRRQQRGNREHAQLRQRVNLRLREWHGIGRYHLFYIWLSGESRDG